MDYSYRKWHKVKYIEGVSVLLTVSNTLCKFIYVDTYLHLIAKNSNSLICIVQFEKPLLSLCVQLIMHFFTGPEIFKLIIFSQLKHLLRKFFFNYFVIRFNHTLKISESNLLGKHRHTQGMSQYTMNHVGVLLYI